MLTKNGSDAVKLSVRRMCKADLLAVAQLEKECFAEAWSENALAESLAEANYVFFVAVVSKPSCMADEKDTEESEDASVADETVKEPETVTPEVTATPEPTQETSPAQEAETTAAPTQQVTPEPTQEAAVQEQHKEAEVYDAETASDTGNSDYVIPYSSTRYLTNTDLTGLSEWQMRIARNEIYARHGRIFKSDDLADYFASKSWYTPSVSADQFDNSYLNAIEIENLKLITAYEKAHNLNQ